MLVTEVLDQVVRVVLEAGCGVLVLVTGVSEDLDISVEGS